MFCVVEVQGPDKHGQYEAQLIEKTHWLFQGFGAGSSEEEAVANAVKSCDHPDAVILETPRPLRVDCLDLEKTEAPVEVFE